MDAHVTCIYFDCRVVNSSGDNKRIYWAAAAPAKDGTLFLLGHEGDEPGASGLEPGLFKLIVTQLPYGVTILDGNHTIRWVNEAFTTITGYSGNEVIGELPGKILYGTHTLNDSDKFLKSFLLKGVAFKREAINYKKNGEAFWMQFEGQPLYDQTAKIDKWLCILCDITEKKKAEDILVTSEAKYRTIFNNSPLLKIIYDPDTSMILEVNEQAITSYDYSIEELLLLSMLSLIPTEFRDQYYEELQTVKNGKVYHGIYDHLKKTGGLMHVEMSSFGIDYKGKLAIIVIGKDITLQMSLRNQLIDEKLKNEKNILKATLFGQEMERLEIGKELHDNISQLLSSAKYCYEMAFPNSGAGVELFKKGNDILENAIQEIRSLSRNLVSSSIKDKALAVSITDLIESISVNKSIDIKLTITGLADEYVFPINLLLFRIIQVQLDNIMKHAFAKHVQINLFKEKLKVNIDVVDDGIGFDPNLARSGIGLNNIISRVRLYNGSVKIISAADKGCTLKVVIPLG